ncbi:MAG: TetR/AcrR family transcriptional regulator [Anaerolineales bacterium]|nr:MAG: TetR/AcrR family transcriptional regulator [Anaerolineales bacterium]
MSPKVDVADERRAQIIQAALACFTRKGYNNTTMDDIVAESGLSKGSLYWYFKSKDDLFAAAFMSLLMDIGQEAFAALEQCTTASDKLRALAQALVNFCKEAEGFFSLFLEFWASSPRREEAGQLWIGMLVQYKDVIVGIIEEGVRNGEFKPVDAEQLAWVLMAAYDGLAAYITLIPDMDLERVSQVFIETLLSGLAADGNRQ